MEIKILLDYLRVIYQPENNEALSRIVNVPRRGVGAFTLKTLLEEAESEKISLWALLTRHCRGQRQAKANLKKAENKLNKELLGLVDGIRAQTDKDGEKGDAQPAKKKSLTLIQIIESLLARLSFKEYIERTYGADDEARWANVEEFMSLAREFMRKAGELEEEDELPEVEGEEQVKETSVLAKFLANVSLVSDADTKAEDDKKPMVTISTIHAAKGLEWPVVFIPAAYNGSLPHSRSEDVDEERRLLFVAMTRAKCLLNISYGLSGTREQEEQELSPFLFRVPPACFLDKGPSYNRSLLEEMGEILGRKVPSDSDIYKNLPMGSRLEDDMFPVDPEGPSGYHDEDGYGGWYGGGSRGGGKRRKTFEASGNMHTGTGAGSVGGVGGVSGVGGGAWHRGYATTMENASGFTMWSMPGFTTASAHQTALLAAEAAAAAADAIRATTAATTKTMAKGKRAAVPPGQQTITSSFCRNGAAPSMPAPAPSPYVVPPRWPSGFLSAQQPPRAAAVVAAAGIPSELTSRRLGGVLPKIMAGHPSATAKAKTAGGFGGFSDQGRPDKHYAHFSSSPARAERTAPRQEMKQPPGPQMARQHHGPGQDVRSGWAGHGKENHHSLAGKGPGAGAGASVSSTAVPPAASLHNTSFAQAASGNRIQPAVTATGIGATPLDKLRRPFKPPSARRT